MVSPSSSRLSRLIAGGRGWTLLLLLLVSVHHVGAQTQCSATQLCANNLCCSQYNYCGNTDPYCGAGCLSGPCTGSNSVGSIITQSIYNQFFLHTNDAACPAAGFYSYSSFIQAAASFSGFGTVGNTTTRKRELAAFLAQVSHETTGGWSTAPDGPYAWGLCYKKEINCAVYCNTSFTQWPCASGKSYCGRGPMQITWNFNYGAAGQAIGSNLLATPELVETNNLISWKTAIWFWMTAQSPKPSAHAVMVGQWTPSAGDQAAGRLPGFGLTTDIINGGLECGHASDTRVQDRIGFYKRYCDILGVSYGSNLDCANMSPY